MPFDDLNPLSDMDITMITKQVPKPIKKLIKQRNVELPPNEVARLLVLKQCRVLDSERNDLEFDRFVALSKRIFQAPYAFISFIDFDRQWIKSSIGITIAHAELPRRQSIDASLVFPNSHELKLILDGREDPLLQTLPAALGVDVKFQFYIAAAIMVDGFKLGALSLLDTKPRDYVSLDERQNLLDLAATVSNLVKERRLRNLQLRKQKANLMLGLNHNLRTPLMSLTLVTEMLRAEIKSLAVNKHHEIGTRKSATPVDHRRMPQPVHAHHLIRRPSFGSMDDSSLGVTDHNHTTFEHIGTHTPSRLQSYAIEAHNDTGNIQDPSSQPNLSVEIPRDVSPSTSSMRDLTQTMKDLSAVRDDIIRSTMSSTRSSVGSSVGHTPDIPCINLLGDLQSSLQQLALLVEMGLVLGKITSGMSVLADGTYDSILCDLIKVYEKVRSLTQRLGRSQNVHWAIDKTILSRGKHYSHPDVLLFVLISALSQLLPHASWIRVKASFLPIEDVTRLVEDEDATRSVVSMVELIAPNVVIGKVGMLLTELEVCGESSNLKDVVSKLHLTGKESEASQTESTASSSDGTDDAALKNPDELLKAEVEDFGGNLFALGSLLENVLGGSSYIMTPTGCIFSFSIPCRVELEPELPSMVGGSQDQDEIKPHSSIIPFDDITTMDSSEDDSSPSSKDASGEQETSSGTVTATNSTSFYSAWPSQDSRSGKERSEKVDMDDDGISIYIKENAIKMTSTSKELPIVPLPTLAATGSNSRPAAAKSSTDNAADLLAELPIERKAYKATLKVLVVDDSVTVQKVLGIWLKKKQCEVTSALNGAVALDLMKEKEFDMVLLDFLMPVMDGLTCLRLFQEWQRSVPPDQTRDQWFVGLSATALREDQEAAFNEGMHMFCSKPLDMQALGYVLEARRMGISFDTLLGIAQSHSSSAMSPQQQRLAVDMMFPPSQQPPSPPSEDASKDFPASGLSGKALPPIPEDGVPEDASKEKAKMTSNRSKARVKFEADRVEALQNMQSNASGLNLFGAIQFNSPVST